MKRLTIGLVALGAVLASAAAQSRPDEPQPRVRDKLICKRWADTGSLVVKKRECHTREDWNKIADSQQRGARLLQDGLMTRPCGGDECAPMGAQTTGISGIN